ncbi:hypothetical protein [Streptomyces nitrosporeus]|uniref:hypothetical protein n=1 Tax=Streptomyces nitrosporeus TaxID=28894 RepID=UPI0033244439
MPAHSKIVDEEEVRKWLQEKKTYKWMVEYYRDVYKIETTISMWANYRRRHRLQRRITRDDDLIPWHVEKQHRWRYDLVMLRLEARLREGQELTAREAQRLSSWRASLEEENAVVHYDPETADGFFLVPRTSEDTDIIRQPAEKTTLRRRAD